jgi:DNA-directed RNA polymerase specialized sigma24 family protein
MNKDWTLTQEAFDTLLAWLDPNRDEAGRKYEDIRRRLIKIFACRGCCEAEDLADETINRVSSKLRIIQSDYSGDPDRYFYGVANKIHREYLRRKRASMTPVPTPASGDVEKEYQCLDRCLQQLTPNNRELVLGYYQQERRAKIDHRRNLAEQLGIALNALRIRAHRIRASLQECVERCVSEATT